jgi:hypothetical protein
MHKKIPLIKRFVSQFAEPDGAAALRWGEVCPLAIHALWRSGSGVAVYRGLRLVTEREHKWLWFGGARQEYCFAQYLELRCSNFVINIWSMNSPRSSTALV